MEADNYMSFVVRLWGEQPESAWHGEVEHIQSGQRWSFGSLPHLLDFLRLASKAPHILTKLLTSEYALDDGAHEHREDIAILHESYISAPSPTAVGEGDGG